MATPNLNDQRLLHGTRLRYPKQKGKGEDESTKSVIPSAKVVPRGKGENASAKLVPKGKETVQAIEEVPNKKVEDPSMKRFPKGKADDKNIKLATKFKGDNVEVVTKARTGGGILGKKGSQSKIDEEECSHGISDVERGGSPVPPDNEMRQAMEGKYLDRRGRSPTRRSRDMPRKEERSPISSSSSSSPSPNPRGHSKQGRRGHRSDSPILRRSPRIRDKPKRRTP